MATVYKMLTQNKNTKCKYTISLNSKYREFPRGQISQVPQKKPRSESHLLGFLLGKVPSGKVRSQKGHQFVMENAQGNPVPKATNGLQILSFPQ